MALEAISPTGEFLLQAVESVIHIPDLNSNRERFSST